MRRFWIAALAIVSTLALASPSPAQHHHHGGHHHGHHHHGHHHHGHHHHHGSGVYFNTWTSSPYWGGYGGYLNRSLWLGVGPGYSSFTYYNGPVYGYYDPYLYDYGLYGYYLPGYTSAADLGFGPQGVKDLLGVDRNFALRPLQQPADPPPADNGIQPQVKEIDWDARTKADRYIELGDQHFQQQKFYDALLRYRMAVNADPNYAVARLRHGFSLVALRRYEEASTVLQKAFALDPQIVKSGFRLDELYADNRMAREGHEEALAQAALDEPERGDLHFVLGMWLLFSGEPDRSRKFFERARDLGLSSTPADTPDGARDL